MHDSKILLIYLISVIAGGLLINSLIKILLFRRVQLNDRISNFAKKYIGKKLFSPILIFPILIIVATSLIALFYYRFNIIKDYDIVLTLLIEIHISAFLMLCSL